MRGKRALARKRVRKIHKKNTKAVKLVGKVTKKGGLTSLTYHPPSKQHSPLPDRMFTSAWTTGQYYNNNGALTTFYFDVIANQFYLPFNSSTTKTVQSAGNFVTAVTGSSAVGTLQPIGQTVLSKMYQSYTVLSHSLTLKLNLAGGYSNAGGTAYFTNIETFGVCIYPWVLTADAQIDFHVATQQPRAVTKYFKCISPTQSMTISLSEPEIQGWSMSAFIDDVSGTHDTTMGSVVSSPTRYRVIFQSMNGVPIGSSDSVELVLKQHVMLTQPVKILV